MHQYPDYYIKDCWYKWIWRVYYELLVSIYFEWALLIGCFRVQHVFMSMRAIREIAHNIYNPSLSQFWLDLYKYFTSDWSYALYVALTGLVVPSAKRNDSSWVPHNLHITQVFALLKSYWSQEIWYTLMQHTVSTLGLGNSGLRIWFVTIHLFWMPIKLKLEYPYKSYSL